MNPYLKSITHFPSTHANHGRLIHNTHGLFKKTLGILCNPCPIQNPFHRYHE